MRTCKRIDALAIPPAWSGVWISPKSNTHVLAYGYDQKHRKQYVYHPQWDHYKQKEKFKRMRMLGKDLTKIRVRLHHDLASEQFSYKHCMATIVSIMDQVGIRVGNQRYTKENKTYGLTTLRTKHVKEQDNSLSFSFIGKSGKEQYYEIDDQELRETIRAFEELPGSLLFNYYDEFGVKQNVSPSQVRDYIRSLVSRDYSPKDFRTWRGTVHAMDFLLEQNESKRLPLEKKDETQLVKHVADQLGNTPAVARERYIHPKIFSCAQKKYLRVSFLRKKRGLSISESAVLKYCK